jgi:hypothetical protein
MPPQARAGEGQPTECDAHLPPPPCPASTGVSADLVAQCPHSWLPARPHLLVCCFRAEVATGETGKHTLSCLEALQGVH